MAGSERIFRKVSLERLSSPEQLDTLIRVVTPNAWLALAPLLCLIALAVAWGWLGSIPLKVSGRCILLNPTGLAEVTSGAAGRLLELPVKVGDSIVQGQALARVAQPEIADRIEKADARLRELESQGQVLRTFAARGATLTTQTLRQNRRNFESQLEAASARAHLATERAQVEEHLLREGLVTAQTVVATGHERVAAELDAQNLRNQIKELELRRLEAEKLAQMELANSDVQINEARRALDSLRGAQRAAVTITSPYAGRVVEIKSGTGMLVTEGSAVLTVEQAGASGQLEAVIYLAAADGKKLKPGMEAQITPSTVQREEHGFIRAAIARVADYPATPQSMAFTLQNDALARELAGNAPPIEARATLKRAATPSGYQWSSAAGPPLTISSGTLCQAEVVVARQTPISLVIPLLKSTLALE
ncbi:MAG: NHLP bacteriocin system secretion protein [Gammaproteobacteria bacterium]|nr:NHLP bacteriocin system secretion protein [Gammaproteobacteria bacterium]